MLAVAALCAGGCRSEEAAPVAVAPAAPVRASAAASALAPRFETYGVAEGLPANEVSAVMQDRRGFLWVGTFGGLARFDGATFTTFLHDPSDTLSLGENTVNALLEDRDGRIWIGTEGGLDRFDPATETFTRLIVREGRFGAVRALAETVEPARAAAGTAASDGTASGDSVTVVWAGGFGTGLFRFEPGSDTPAQIRHPARADGALERGDVVAALTPGADGTLWVGSHDGLHRLDPATGRFTRVAAALAGVAVFSLAVDAAGDLWAGTYDDGLHRVRPRTGEVRHYASDPARPDALGNPWVISLLADRAGTLWAGTDGGGLSRHAPAADAFARTVHDITDPRSLAADRVLALFEDRTGVLWVGSYGGLQRRYPLSRVVERVASRPGDPASLSANDVTAFAEDGDGTLWIGTDGGGLNRADAPGASTGAPTGASTGSHFTRVRFDGPVGRGRG